MLFVFNYCWRLTYSVWNPCCYLLYYLMGFILPCWFRNLLVRPLVYYYAGVVEIYSLIFFAVNDRVGVGLNSSFWMWSDDLCTNQRGNRVADLWAFRVTHYLLGFILKVGPGYGQMIAFLLGLEFWVGVWVSNWSFSCARVSLYRPSA